MQPRPQSPCGEDIKSNDVAHHEDIGLDLVKSQKPGAGDAIHGARSKWEDLDTKSTFRLFWKGALVCFFAAFSSFTDGYQVCRPRRRDSQHLHRQIAIIGNIIGNRGFIDQMGTEVSRETGLVILAPGVLAAWTAIGSVCQWLWVPLPPYECPANRV